MGSNIYIYIYLFITCNLPYKINKMQINIHNMDSKGVSLGVLPLQS